MIEYFIDGSAKENIIGVGIVKVNEFGFVEKFHYSIENIKPTSNIAEGFALQKAFELIQKNDSEKNELINIYTDNQNLHNSFFYHVNVEFNRSSFFAKQETNNYYHYLRNLYIGLISRNTNLPMYHCLKTKEARPTVKIYYKDDVEDKKFLQEAHLLSRKYINEENKREKKETKVESKKIKIQLKAVRKNEQWYIVKNNKGIMAGNKRPLIALSEALKQINSQTSEIHLCDTLTTILKSTNKNNLSNSSIKSAVKIIETHKLPVNL
ncbi:hypothetical protein [Bacillus suaedaesalsae]|uniref:RNase H type-1 domain-containing protein n=1 Tax=Bacillus suaedaesalsae TaxID=2810349 RepID=A0ABS2DJE5_9BACI|nr:hypothetical protein [Bacillus suaedaesalsae]MBM6618511.1 hypothetical protein [Bacillus suaedaesalsae]